MSTKTTTQKVTTVTCDYCGEAIRLDYKTDYYRLALMSFDDDHDVRAYMPKVTEDLHVSCLRQRILGQKQA